MKIDDLSYSNIVNINGRIHNSRMFHREKMKLITKKVRIDIKTDNVISDIF